MAGADELQTRITIRVKPGARRAQVGGEHGGALVVAVSARAVDGSATEAALAAVAAAFGVKARHVRLVTGATSRTKIVSISEIPAALVKARLAELLTTHPRS